MEVCRFKPKVLSFALLDDCSKSRASARGIRSKTFLLVAVGCRFDNFGAA